jgi:hypothetical protein
MDNGVMVAYKKGPIRAFFAALQLRQSWRQIAHSKVKTSKVVVTLLVLLR